VVARRNSSSRSSGLQIQPSCLVGAGRVRSTGKEREHRHVGQLHPLGQLPNLWSHGIDECDHLGKLIGTEGHSWTRLLSGTSSFSAHKSFRSCCGCINDSLLLPFLGDGPACVRRCGHRRVDPVSVSWRAGRPSSPRELGRIRLSQRTHRDRHPDWCADPISGRLLRRLDVGSALSPAPDGR
jgi:hypothetical protein